MNIRSNGSLEDDVRLGFSILNNSKEFCDTTLIGLTDRDGGEHEISVHRIVLALRSSVLKARFGAGGAWFEQDKITLEFHNFDVVRMFVTFLYTDSVEWNTLSLVHCVQLWKISTTYEISRLNIQAYTALQRYLENTRNDKNWWRNVLAIQEMTVTESLVDLSTFCASLYSDLNHWSEQAKLLRAMHEPVPILFETPRSEKNAILCSASLCVDLILRLFTKEEALRYSVLTGRTDIVEEMLSRDVPTEEPSEIDGLLPVELALRLGQRKKQQQAPTADTNGGDSSLYIVDWVTLEELDDVVQALVLHSSTAIQEDTVQPMLNLASKLGNVFHVRALIKSGSDVNVRDETDGRTPLHCATEAGHLEVARELLAGHAIPNIQDHSGCTPLHIASRKGNLEIVALLMPSVNASMPDKHGRTALHHAAMGGHAEVARRLLQDARNPRELITTTEYESGSTPMHFAAANAYIGVVLVMLNFANEDVTIQDRLVNNRDLQGRSPLHEACRCANNAIGNHNIALFQRSCKVVESLLDSKADAIALTKAMYTPLHYALGGGQETPMPDNSTDSGSLYPSQTLAKLRGQQTGGDRESNFMEGHLLGILLTARNGSMAVRAAGGDGITPLHLAVKFGYFRAVSTLVQRGADINARDRRGTSPLSVAREYWPLPILATSFLKLLPSPPNWVDDALGVQCECCETHFSIANRRHHCRHCGCIVCSQCSSNSIPIPKFGLTKAVRVCNACHEALSWPSPTESDEMDDDLNTFLEASTTNDAASSESDTLPAEAHSPVSTGSGRAPSQGSATPPPSDGLVSRRFIKVKAKKRGATKTVALN